MDYPTTGYSTNNDVFSMEVMICPEMRAVVPFKPFHDPHTMLVTLLMLVIIHTVHSHIINWGQFPPSLLLSSFYHHSSTRTYGAGNRPLEPI